MQRLTEKERAVYLPLVARSVGIDPHTTESDAKQILNYAGLDLSDDRIKIMLDVARRAQ